MQTNPHECKHKATKSLNTLSFGIYTTTQPPPTRPPKNHPSEGLSTPDPAPATSFVAALDPRLLSLPLAPSPPGFVYVYLLAQFGYIVCLQSTHCLQGSLLFLKSSLHRLSSGKICCQEQHKESLPKRRAKESISL